MLYIKSSLLAVQNNTLKQIIEGGMASFLICYYPSHLNLLSLELMSNDFLYVGKVKVAIKN